MSTDLAVDRRQLLAALSTWARTNGWRRSLVPHCYFNADRTTEVRWEPDLGFVGIFQQREPGDPYVSAASVISVQQGIDVLAALDVLPCYFSSQYGAGRASLHVAEWGRVTGWAN